MAQRQEIHMSGLATHPNIPNKEMRSSEEQRKEILFPAMGTPREQVK
jgi:hypothetical protein